MNVMGSQVSRSRRVLRIAVAAAAILATAGILGHARFYIERGTHLGWKSMFVESLLWISCYCAWLPVLPAVYAAERRLRLERADARRNIFYLIGVSFVLAYAAYLISRFLAHAFWFITQGTQLPEPFGWLIPIKELGFYEALFWCIFAAVAVLRRRHESAEWRYRASQLKIEKANLESALRKAELDTLRLRLNPHFLFNALQNVSVLAKTDPDTASRLLARLGELIRVALHSKFESEIPLREELKLTRAYLELEQMRFGNKLKTELNIADEAGDCRVPSLLLQPIVENAIVHGLANLRDGGSVRIAARIELGRLVLSVSDNGHVQKDEEDAKFSPGIGLGGTVERLQRLYGDSSSIRVSRRAGLGTQVAIMLPVQSPTAPPDIGTPSFVQA